VDIQSFAGDRRNERTRLFELHVALAGLFRVVERVRVKKGPDKLPGDVLQAKFKIRVLINGVMAGVERQRTDRVALLVGDLARTDHTRRVAGARSRDRSGERHARRVSQRNLGLFSDEHARKLYL